jgi:methionine synthase II (cobalamin-independent)
MNILEFGVGSQAVLLSTQVAFQQLQPTITCVSPWMKYVVMASLVTRGQLNFFDIFKGIGAKSKTPRCQKGIYMKSRGCYVPKNPEIARAVERSKKMSRRIIRMATKELNTKGRALELRRLREEVRSIRQRYYP